MKDVSQRKMGFIVVLHVVRYLCVFDFVAILKNQGSEGHVSGKALAMFGL